MLKIKFKRIGKKHEPHYRIVLSETSSPKKNIEFLGFYDPKLKIKKVNEERIRYWLAKGAKLSDTVHNLMVSLNIIKEKKIAKHKKKKQETKS